MYQINRESFSGNFWQSTLYSSTTGSLNVCRPLSFLLLSSHHLFSFYHRLVQIIVGLSPGQGLGLSIVGGRGSSTGDVPIYVKRILPESVLQKDSKIKTGDELVAVNDLIIHNVTKDYATEALTNVQGPVRLLLIQDLWMRRISGDWLYWMNGSTDWSLYLFCSLSPRTVTWINATSSTFT